MREKVKGRYETEKEKAKHVLAKHKICKVKRPVQGDVRCSDFSKKFNFHLYEICKTLLYDTMSFTNEFILFYPMHCYKRLIKSSILCKYLKSIASFDSYVLICKKF